MGCYNSFVIRVRRDESEQLRGIIEHASSRDWQLIASPEDILSFIGEHLETAVEHIPSANGHGPFAIPPAAHHPFIVQVWTGSNNQLRGVIADVQVGRHQGFTDLKVILAFLEQQMNALNDGEGSTVMTSRASR